MYLAINGLSNNLLLVSFISSVFIIDQSCCLSRIMDCFVVKQKDIRFFSERDKLAFRKCCQYVSNFTVYSRALIASDD